MMSTYELIMQRRTIRKFKQQPLEDELLERCVNAARVAPSAANLQPLEYIVVADPEAVEQVFPHTAWAGYLPDWKPQPGEQPVAYIFVLINREHCPQGGDMDVGIAAENITLTALEEGVGSCMIGSLNRVALTGLLGVPEHCEISLAIALGYAAEDPIMEDMKDDSIKYYRDEDGRLHVPKRSLDQILHWDTY